MDLFILQSFLILAVCIPLIDNILHTGKVSYKFRRNILFARPIPCAMIGFELFVFANLLIVDKNILYSVDFELVSTMIITVILIVFTLIEYAKISEGVYSNGLVLRGLFYKWKLIHSYEAIVTDSGTVILDLCFITKTKTVYRRFNIHKTDWNHMENIFEKNIK